MKGRDLMAKGLCWRVGNGRDIDIWKDPWVPSIEGFKLVPISQDPPLIHKVSQLIDTTSREWMLDGINHIISLD